MCIYVYIVDSIYSLILLYQYSKKKKKKKKKQQQIKQSRSIFIVHTLVFQI